jgi:hypothetical protein
MYQQQVPTPTTSNYRFSIQTPSHRSSLVEPDQRLPLLCLQELLKRFQTLMPFEEVLHGEPLWAQQEIRSKSTGSGRQGTANCDSPEAKICEVEKEK